MAALHTLYRTLCQADGTALDAAFAKGVLPDVERVADAEYYGFNIGFIQGPLGIRKFKKAFYKRPSGRTPVAGYNAKVKPTGLDGPWDNGGPGGAYQGYYDVKPASEGKRLGDHPNALFLDYGTDPSNTLLDGSFLRDFVTQPDPAVPEVLLGLAYIELGPVRMKFGYFVLQKAHGVTQPASFLGRTVSETGVLRARTVLRLAVDAAGSQLFLVVPLAIAEFLAALLGLVPALVVVTAVFVEAGRAGGGTDPMSLLFSWLRVMADPATPAILVAGLALAAFGAFLLRTFVQAVAVSQVAPQLAEPGAVETSGAVVSLLADPGRWLAAAGLAAVLRVVLVVSTVGAVWSAMAFFVAIPGVAAALGMTLATSMIVSVPLLDAALDLGVVRAVLGGEGPVSALGEGILLAIARRRALVTVWFLGVMADLAIGLGEGSGAGLLSRAPAEQGFWVLVLGPRAMLFAVAAFASALVALVRLAAYAAIVQDSSDALRVVDAAEVVAPVIDAPVIDAPVIDAPVIDASVVDAPVVEAPVIEANVVEAPPPGAVGGDVAGAASEAPVNAVPERADTTDAASGPPTDPRKD